MKVKTDLFTTLIGAVQTVAKNTKQDADNPSDDIVLSQVKAFINGAEKCIHGSESRQIKLSNGTS